MSQAKAKGQIEQVMTPTTFERAAAMVVPRWAINRMRARAMFGVGQFIGARFDRNATKLWNPRPGDADSDLLGDLQALRNRSRDTQRNAPIASGAIDTMVRNSVGRGLRLQACPDADVLGLSPARAQKLKQQIEREFRIFAESPDCDITRKENFYEQSSLAARSTFESGDVFALTPMITRTSSPYSTCIQLIEADRVMNPVDNMMDTEDMRAGIEYNANGEPTKYHIRKQHPFSRFGRMDTEEVIVPAFGERTGRRNVVHVFKRKRPGQTRGIPVLAPVIEPLRQLDKYTEAELMAAVVSACFTVFIKTPAGDGISTDLGQNAAVDQVEGGSSDSVPILAANDIALGNGSIVDLMPGEEAQFANPGRPNAAFDPFVQSILRLVGVGLGLPFEVLIKHYTASYSAARAAIIEAWTFFMEMRDFVATNFCQPIYEVWFEEAVAIGRIDAPGFFADPALRRAYLQAEWIGSAMPQIDPLKEVQAARERIDGQLSTLTKETLELTGKDYADNVAQLGVERSLRAAAGIADPQPVTPSKGPNQNGNGQEDGSQQGGNQ